MTTRIERALCAIIFTIVGCYAFAQGIGGGFPVGPDSGGSGSGGGTSTDIRVGVTTVSGGSTGRVLYDNASVLGELPVTGTGSVVLATSPTIASPAFSGTVTGANTIPLGVIAQSGANTMLGNWSGSTANVSANAIPSCADTTGNHLNYVSGTGITCGTSARASLSKMISISRDMTAASGAVTTNGFGFQPTSCNFWAGVDGLASISIGSIASDATQMSLQIVGGLGTHSNTNAILLYGDVAGSTAQIGSAAFVADGVTITWSKNGVVPAGTANVQTICTR